MEGALKEVKELVKRGIEKERSKMDEKYISLVDEVDNSDSVPSIIAKLVDVYGNTVEQSKLMSRILGNYLTADYFKKGEEVRETNMIGYRSGKYTVKFPMYKSRHIEISRDEEVKKPKEVKELSKEYEGFYKAGKEYEKDKSKRNYNELIKEYALLLDRKVTIWFRLDVKVSGDLAEDIKRVNNIYKMKEKEKDRYYSKLEKYREHEKEVKGILDGIRGDLERFKESGWSIGYKNICEDIVKKYEI